MIDSCCIVKFILYLKVYQRYPFIKRKFDQVII